RHTRLQGDWSSDVCSSDLMQNGDSQNTGSSSNPRPNVVTGQSVARVMSDRTLTHWFNTAAFVRSICNGCPGAGIYIPPLGYGNRSEERRVGKECRSMWLEY